MIWNDITVIVFLAYIIIMPLLIGVDPIMTKDNLTLLLIFDITFMADRILDLFVGYYTPNGLMEHRLTHVLYQNLTTKFFLEIIMIAGPLIIYRYN